MIKKLPIYPLVGHLKQSLLVDKINEIITFLNSLDETLMILNDKPLMDNIRKSRKSGSKCSPYKPLQVEKA